MLTKQQSVASSTRSESLSSSPVAGAQDRIYLRAKEVEQKYGPSARTLANLRSQGKGPRYYKFGGMVLYSPADVEAYMEIHTAGAGKAVAA